MDAGSFFQGHPEATLRPPIADVFWLRSEPVCDFAHCGASNNGAKIQFVFIRLRSAGTVSVRAPGEGLWPEMEFLK